MFDPKTVAVARLDGIVHAVLAKAQLPGGRIAAWVLARLADGKPGWVFVVASPTSSTRVTVAADGTLR